MRRQNNLKKKFKRFYLMDKIVIFGVWLRRSLYCFFDEKLMSGRLLTHAATAPVSSQKL